MLKTFFTAWDPVLATVVAVAAFVILILLLKPWRWFPEKEEPRHPSRKSNLQPASSSSGRVCLKRVAPTIGPDVPSGRDSTAGVVQSRLTGAMENIASTREPSPASNLNLQPQPLSPSPETPEALWRRARQMPHSMIPDPILDGEYLALVHASAESGCVPALAKLGDYAFRRQTFVEAYFWTKLAERRLTLLPDADPRLLEAVRMMLREIRRRWAQTGRSPEFENVHEFFPPERADLGRAFLQMDSGKNAWQVRQFIRDLAQAGNPDATLFA